MTTPFRSRRATQRRTRPGLRAVLAAAPVAMIGGVPVFMLGAVAVLVERDLALDEVGLGLAVSSFFAAAAVAGVRGGPFVERLGGRRALVVAALSGAVTLGGLASAWSWSALFFWMVVGGVVNAISQLSANLRIAGGVDGRRLGIAVAVKQASIPGGTLLAGLAVPLVALTLGWRWVFCFGAVLALLIAAALWRDMTPPTVTRRTRPRPIGPIRGPIVVLGFASGFGGIGLTAMSTFIVTYAVDIGMEPGQAGLVLAGGSVGAIAVRLVLGWSADRRPGSSLLVTAWLLFVGAAAVGVVAFTSAPLALSLLAVLAFATGTGWSGLANLAVLRLSPHAPAAAIGITFTGSSIGCIVGPTAFGVLASSYGYEVAWLFVAASFVAAAALMLLGRAWARRWRARLLRAAEDGSGPSTPGDRSPPGGPTEPRAVPAADTVPDGVTE